MALVAANPYLALNAVYSILFQVMGSFIGGISIRSLGHIFLRFCRSINIKGLLLLLDLFFAPWSLHYLVMLFVCS